MIASSVWIMQNRHIGGLATELLAHHVLSRPILFFLQRLCFMRITSVIRFPSFFCIFSFSQHRWKLKKQKCFSESADDKNTEYWKAPAHWVRVQTDMWDFWRKLYEEKRGLKYWHFKDVIMKKTIDCPSCGSLGLQGAIYIMSYF